MKRMEGGSWEVWLTGRKKGDENNRLCWDLILLQRKYKSRIAAFKGPRCPLLWGKKGRPVRRLLNPAFRQSCVPDGRILQRLRRRLLPVPVKHLLDVAPEKDGGHRVCSTGLSSGQEQGVPSRPHIS